MEKENLEKIEALLVQFYNSHQNRNWIKDLVQHSDFKFNSEYISPGQNSYNLVLSTEPNVFLKKFDFIQEAKDTLKKGINALSNILILEVEIKPNYNRFQIINSKIQPILTDWNEINELQSDLIDNLKRTRNEVDARNIGNTCRIMLDKLAGLVFDREKHITDIKKDVSSSKFKNKLHSFIKAELSGTSNKELRQFSESAITTVEKTIDLTNNVTHNKKADKFLSEYCVVATIGIISLIKMVQNLN